MTSEYVYVFVLVTNETVNAFPVGSSILHHHVYIKKEKNNTKMCLMDFTDYFSL